MSNVVKKEVLKLLEVGIIYQISDSKWVSPCMWYLEREVSQLYKMIKENK